MRARPDFVEDTGRPGSPTKSDRVSDKSADFFWS